VQTKGPLDMLEIRVRHVALLTRKNEIKMRHKMTDQQKKITTNRPYA